MEFMNNTKATSAAATGGVSAVLSNADTSSAVAPPLAKKNPTDFLKQVIGKPVIVKLYSGVTYKGILACLDGFMNIAMEQTEEYVDGQLKNRYGDCFLRGNNVLYICAAKPKK